MARVLINLRARARRGELIEIKTLIAHPMETGYRLGPTGAAIPRDIIRRFLCTYNGEEVFRAELFPAIAANPFIAFFTVATESGEITSARLTTTERRRPRSDKSPSNESVVVGARRCHCCRGGTCGDRTRRPVLGI
jgi:sulfur-oxidizing protein SoxZ